MGPTLRDFITTREHEIKEQLKLLKAELRDLQIVKIALDANGDAAQTLGQQAQALTIKDLARDVLSRAEEGLTAQDILAKIKAIHGRDLDRTSLSPQLSRLKADGDVVLNGERWFLKHLHDGWQQKIMLGVFEQEEEKADLDASSEAWEASLRAWEAAGEKSR